MDADSTRPRRSGVRTGQRCREPPGGHGYPALVDERYETELGRAAAVLDGVDDALDRLSAGTYGTCATCGTPVLDADLETDPARRQCEQHLALG